MSINPKLDDIDFTRYAPAQQQVAVFGKRLDAQPPEDLLKIGRIVRAAIQLIIRSLQIGVDIIADRTITWTQTHILHSLRTSWTLGGIGWGGFLACAGLLYLAR
jgi:hypothetical protein